MSFLAVRFVVYVLKYVKSEGASDMLIEEV
jgi:hypothetical protein